MIKMMTVEKRMQSILNSWNKNGATAALKQLAVVPKEARFLVNKESCFTVSYMDYEMHVTYYPEEIDMVWARSISRDLEEVSELPRDAVEALRKCFAANLIKYGFCM